MLAAFLNEDGNADFRIALRGVTHEPGVVGKLRAFFHEIHFVVADDLRGAGFAAKLDASEFEFTAGAAWFVDDTIHSVRHFFDRGVGDVKTFLADLGRVLEHVRLLKDAAGSNATNHTGELQRRGSNGALSGGDGDDFAGVPLTMKGALDPLLRRHEAGLFG